MMGGWCIIKMDACHMLPTTAYARDIVWFKQIVWIATNILHTIQIILLINDIRQIVHGLICHQLRSLKNKWEIPLNSKVFYSIQNNIGSYRSYHFHLGANVNRRYPFPVYRHHWKAVEKNKKSTV